MAFVSQLILVLAIFLPAHSRSNSSSSEGFPSESIIADLISRLDAQEAQIGILMKGSVQSRSICLGQVSASEFYPKNDSAGILTQVNTAHCNFRNMPIYLTSLGGMNSIWYVAGATSIYNATRTGFRVYLGTRSNNPTSEELLDTAKQLGWTLNWAGLE